MATVRDLIKGSLRLIGVVASGETPSSDEQADGLLALNDMIDSWSNEGLLIHATVREEFTLTPGTGVYTLGSSGTFNTSRPMKIERAAIEVQTTAPFEVPVEILSLDQWVDLSSKGLSGNVPSKLFAEGTYPLDTLNLWPVPTDANHLVLYSLKPLSSFASVNTTVSLPQGYARAIRYNLAIELAPEYGKAAAAEIVMKAEEAKESIKRSNAKPQYLSCDEGALARSKAFNIVTGE